MQCRGALEFLLPGEDVGDTFQFMCHRGAVTQFAPTGYDFTIEFQRFVELAMFTQDMCQLTVAGVNNAAVAKSSRDFRALGEAGPRGLKIAHVPGQSPSAIG